MNANHKRSLLKVCAWCSPQRVIDQNGRAARVVTVEDTIRFHLSHGMCVDCSERLEEQEDLAHESKWHSRSLEARNPMSYHDRHNPPKRFYVSLVTWRNDEPNEETYGDYATARAAKGVATKLGRNLPADGDHDVTVYERTNLRFEWPYWDWDSVQVE